MIALNMNRARRSGAIALYTILICHCVQSVAQPSSCIYGLILEAGFHTILLLPVFFFRKGANPRFPSFSPMHTLVQQGEGRGAFIEFGSNSSTIRCFGCLYHVCCLYPVVSLAFRGQYVFAAASLVFDLLISRLQRNENKRASKA